jgi:uncharacterized protein (TIGR02099 family)
MSAPPNIAARFVRRIATAVVILATTGLVVVALAVTAARVVLPHTDADNIWVAGVLGERLGYPMRVGSAGLNLFGLRPRLRVRDILLSDPERGGDVLALDALEIEIDPIASLRAGVPQITAMTLVGSRLAARVDREGRLRVDGLELLRDGAPRALEFLITRARVDLVLGEILIRDERPDVSWDGLRLTDLRLQLVNDGERHSLSATAALHSLDPPFARVAGNGLSGRGDSVENRLRLRADLSGPPADPLAWHGRVYAGIDAGDLDRILGANGLDSVSVRTERAAIESWSRLRAGLLEQTLVRVDLDNLRLGPRGAVAGSAEPLRVERLSALLRARPHGDGWQLQVGEVAGRLSNRGVGGELPKLEVDLHLDSERRPRRLRVASDSLDIAAAFALLAESPWSLPESLSRVAEAKPRGRLRDLAVRADWDPDQPMRWVAAADGVDLGWNRVASLPGVDGLAARLRVDERGGEAQIGSAGLALNITPLFGEPFRLDRLAARLQWRTDETGTLRVTGRNLTLENADLAGRARFALALPADGAGAELDLRASFHDGDGSRMSTYLPVGIMHPDLVRWLKRAVVSGRIPQADLIFRGPLAAYPFRGHEGRFELLLELEDGVLDYLAGWPAIREAAGRLHFLDQTLAVELDRGRILDSRLIHAHGEIDDLWGVQRMAIVGEAEGPFSDGLRVLAETPLSKNLGQLAGILEVTGDSRLGLEIDLPFTKSRPLEVSGRLSWPKPAALTVRSTAVQLSQLGGELTFTRKSVTARTVEAELWGRPLSLSIETINPGDPAASSTAIKARARTPVAELGRRFPSPAWDVLAGTLDWELDLSIRNRDVGAAEIPLGYRMSSTLDGLSIDLPAPLGKTAAETRALDLAGDLVAGRSLRVAGRLGMMAADLRLDSVDGNTHPLRARVRLGAESTPPPTGDGVFIDGRLAELDLPAWLGRFGTLKMDLQRIDSRGEPGPEPWLSGAELVIDRLSLGGPRLTEVDLSLASIPSGSRQGGWGIDISANELVGRLEIPATLGQPVDLALDRLDAAALRDPADDGVSGPSVASHARSFPDLPSLDLAIAGLTWGDTRLGALELELRSDLLGTRLKNIRLFGDGVVSAEGEAAWMRTDGSGRSEVSMRVNAADVGVLLTATDSRNRIQSAPMEAKLMLDWPGGFGDFKLARALGFVDVTLGAGRLLNVEPGVGRLLGFLNLSALERRLSMDFRDLYEEGFAFEEMRGRIQVGDGKATLDNFTIEGPASKVIVEGRSDLVNQRFDQTVIVEPRLGSGIALASAVAGGPVVGAAVYLVDRLAGNAIDALGRYKYRVTGPWTDPDVQRVGWDPAVGGETLRSPGDGSPPPNHFLD